LQISAYRNPARDVTDRPSNAALPRTWKESHNVEANQVLDTRGLNCPLPILRTRKILNTLQSGETLKMASPDPGSLKDMVAFCAQTGNVLLSARQAGGLPNPIRPAVDRGMNDIDLIRVEPW
jgi:tRNA 2-thiouridine synthesizing protein A